MRAEESATAQLAVLAELHPSSRRPDRIHAVLGWGGPGDQHYQPLPVADPAHLPVGEPRQLSFELGALTGPQPSSSGLTWRTWSLASVPVELRHLPPVDATQALARQLASASS
jgi:uncharacterized protein (DUF58 family)